MFGLTLAVGVFHRNPFDLEQRRFARTMDRNPANGSREAAGDRCRRGGTSPPSGECSPADRAEEFSLWKPVSRPDTRLASLQRVAK